MFQKDALLPWATTQSNVMLPMEARGEPDVDEARRLIRVVGLEGFEKHYPWQLSGGMRKRVQLARLLAQEPDVLLMDEPFGALDAQTRLTIHEEFLRSVEANRQTVVFVTHDLAEAITLADRILLFSARPGRIKGESRGGPPAAAQRDRRDGTGTVPRALPGTVGCPSSRCREDAADACAGDGRVTVASKSLEAAVAAKHGLGRRAALPRAAARGLASVVLAIVVAIWEGVVYLGWTTAFWISTPLRIVVQLEKDFLSGEIWPHIWATLPSTLGGFVIGSWRVSSPASSSHAGNGSTMQRNPM